MSEETTRPKRIPQATLQRELGRRIVDLRQARGWMQGDLAKRLEVPRGRLGKWERGLNAPSLEDLNMLEAVLEVTLDELVHGHESALPLLPPGERLELGSSADTFMRILKLLMERLNGRPATRAARRGAKDAGSRAPVRA
jgi:putative transcriptional regulator